MEKREKHRCWHTGDGNTDSMIKTIIWLVEIADNIKWLLKEDKPDIEELDYWMEELECETNILLDSYDRLKEKIE